MFSQLKPNVYEYAHPFIHGVSTHMRALTKKETEREQSLG